MSAPINLSDNSAKAWEQRSANTFNGGSIDGGSYSGPAFNFGSGSISNGYGVPKWVWIALAVTAAVVGFWFWKKRKG